MAAAFSFEFGMEAVTDERVLMRAADQIDRAASASVSAARTSARDELLPAERHAPVAAATRLNVNIDFVDEHEEETARLAASRSLCQLFASAGRMLMTRP